MTAAIGEGAYVREAAIDLHRADARLKAKSLHKRRRGVPRVTQRKDSRHSRQLHDLVQAALEPVSFDNCVLCAVYIRVNEVSKRFTAKRCVSCPRCSKNGSGDIVNPSRCAAG